MLPKDPVILLSVVNTRLRDCCDCLASLCAQNDISPEELCQTLAAIGYHYDREQNQFI